MTDTLNPSPFTTLISAASLAALVDAGTPVTTIDVSFDLADVIAGEHAWRDAHLSGSLYLHLDRDLCGAKTGSDGQFLGRHPLPSRADFALTLARSGITPATQVVALDRQGGIYAARLWWMLRWMGHPAVAVLDGGVAAWVESGGALTTEVAVPAAPAPPPSAPYPSTLGSMPTVSAGELAAQLGRARLVDARAGERFRGEVEPLDAAAGHIPGALNHFFKNNLGSDGRFKPAAQLRADFDALLGLHGASAVVHQCGSGVTACHNLLAMEYAGLTGSALYPGSWSEWSSDPARPVALGG
jgi:thiosulfate/3-mercaptopyruvate sulfurtransferase